MIQSFFFFTMCLMVGADNDKESDCSYIWQMTNSNEFYNLVFSVFYPESKIDPNDTLGFTAPVDSFKFILIKNSTNWEKVLEHEGEHATCNLNNPKVDYYNQVCNWKLDRQFLTRGSVMPDYGWVTDRTLPKISDKMEFTLRTEV